MKRSLSVILFLLFAAVMITCNKSDQPAPADTRTGAVKGAVYNSYNQLLSGARITVQRNSSTISGTTNAGNYFFSNLVPGSYTVSVSKEGYMDASSAVNIRAGDTTTKDFTLTPGTAYLNLLSDTLVVAGGFEGSFVIRVSSNSSWVLNNSSSWLTPSKTNSNGDDSVVVRLTNSTDDTTRQALLQVQAGSLVKRIVVQQVAHVKLLQSLPKPGNLATSTKDSVILFFNQPVTVTSIIPGNMFCQSDIQFTYTGNKITFSYACGSLGGDYPFTIATRNSRGDQYTFTFSVGFYNKCINLTGTISRYFVNDADNSYWILTDHPNALYKIDMTSFDILHRYDLPYEPVMFTVNPYNNKIYLAYRQVPKLYILNQDGTTNEVINIVHDTSRTQYESDGPRIYPIQLAFTRNGKGMIWLTNTYYGYNGFWFIDAADNHRIWYQSLPGEEVNYNDVSTNFDKSKLVLTYMNDDPTIGRFDPETMQFTKYRPTRTTRGVFNTPSRKNGNVYSGQLYNQLIVNPDTGVESLESFKDNRSFGSVDFVYKPGRESSIYFAEEAHIEVLDYSTRTSPVDYDAIYFLKGTTATLDGRFLIVYRHDGNYNAKVIQLPATWFDY